MDVLSAILHRRTIRRFQDRPVPREVLHKLVEVSRLYASGGNMQPIRFGIISQKEKTDALFSNLAWAMYLPDFEILPQQQPKAYIVLLRDDRISHSCKFDVGAAATSLMLAAEGFGLSSCCLASFKSTQLRELMGLEEHLCPELVIALGYADQVSDIAPHTGTPAYYENEAGELRVPKYSTEEVLVYADTE